MTIKEIKAYIKQLKITDKEELLNFALAFEKLYFIHTLKIETLNISKNVYNYDYVEWLINRETENFDLFCHEICNHSTINNINDSINNYNKDRKY